MREIKRYALILLTLALLLSGCALPEMKGVDWEEIKGKESAEPTAAPAPTPTPRPAGAEGAVLDFLEALSYDDRVMVRALGGETLPGFRSAQPLESRSLRELYRSVYQSLTWHIGAVNESNANATVTVEITAPDMRKVLSAFSESIAAETLTAENREAKCDELFLYALEDAGRESVTKKVNISLYRRESAWVLDMSGELMNALTGGLTQGLMDFDVPAAATNDGTLGGEDREERSAGIEHHDHDTDKGDDTGNQTYKALLHAHLHVVSIVGKAAHKLAVGVGVKETQRQLLKLIKELCAQTVDTPVGKAGHGDHLNILAHSRQKIDNSHQKERGSQFGQTFIHGNTRLNQGVEDGANEITADNAADSMDDHADKDKKQHQLVGCYIANQSQEGLFSILGFLKSTAGTMATAALGVGTGLHAVFFPFSHWQSPLPAGTGRFPCKWGSFPSTHRVYPRTQCGHRPVQRSYLRSGRN